MIQKMTKRAITHHIGDSSHDNPSEDGLYQNEHWEHLLFDDC